MINIDIDALFKAAAKVQLPTTVSARSGNSSLSFGIVNSTRNGKRLSFSKGLVHALGLEKNASLLPLSEEGVLMIAKDLPFNSANSVTLRGDDGRKVAYAADVIILLTEIFKLDFSQHVSATFDDVSIENYDGTPVAVVSIFSNKDGEQA